MTVQNAERQLTNALFDSFRRGDGWPTENDGDLNAASRAIVDSMYAENGQAYLGKINLYGEDQPIWEYDGETMVYNFGASFVLLCFDAELERLILARASTPYTGTRADAVLVDEILDRIKAVGGVSLFWS